MIADANYFWSFVPRGGPIARPSPSPVCLMMCLTVVLRRGPSSSICCHSSYLFWHPLLHRWRHRRNLNCQTLSFAFWTTFYYSAALPPTRCCCRHETSCSYFSWICARWRWYQSRRHHGSIVCAFVHAPSPSSVSSSPSPRPNFHRHHMYWRTTKRHRRLAAKHTYEEIT